MYNFKVGDKVVCIDNDSLVNSYGLIKYKIYTVLVINYANGEIVVDNINQCIFSINRFISLKDFRKQKLNKIFQNE